MLNTEADEVIETKGKLYDLTPDDFWKSFKEENRIEELAKHSQFNLHATFVAGMLAYRSKLRASAQGKTIDFFEKRMTAFDKDLSEMADALEQMADMLRAVTLDKANTKSDSIN